MVLQPPRLRQTPQGPAACAMPGTERTHLGMQRHERAKQGRRKPHESTKDGDGGRNHVGEEQARERAAEPHGPVRLGRVVEVPRIAEEADEDPFSGELQGRVGVNFFPDTNTRQVSPDDSLFSVSPQKRVRT